MQGRLVPIFFISGIAGLTFETVWFRLAGLSLGNSVWSASLVLAAFMGGLTLGNGLVARFSSRIERPIRLYALLEIAIGIASLLVVLALPRLTVVLGPVLASVTDTPWLLNLTRLGSAFILLVLPTTAMGATLPLLADALSRSNPSFGAAVGKLYGWNTLGAMLGAIATETVLVHFLGIVSTGLFAMVLNLLAGALALQLASHPVPAAQPAPASPPFSARAWRYLFVAALSGAVMLALEVVWFRFLLLTYTGTGLTFAVMLATVLAGIGLGGLLAGKLAQRDESCHRWLPHVTAFSGLLVVATYYGFEIFSPHFSRRVATLPEFIGCALFLMLPVSLLSGAAFTFVAHAVKREFFGSIRTTGIVALWNTIGATFGSLLGGFVLLPVLGIERSLFALAAAYCVTALLVPGLANRAAEMRYAWGSVAITVISLALFPFGHMDRSFFRSVDEIAPDRVLVARREGLNETIRYYRYDAFGAPAYYQLVTNGYSMSGTLVVAKRYMKLYVYLPLALQADARDALLISYGVGSTAKALTDSSRLEHIDVVDISREILEMSSIVYPGDDNPLHDPRVKVHVEDGRFFLNTHARKYDLITSEPPPPKVAGVVNLYTQEYFQSIRDHLTPEGRTSYWLPVHQLQPMDTLAIIKAFCNVFEDCTLWDGGGLEWMLMGGNGANPRVDEETFTAQWRDDVVRPELIELGFETPEQFGALFMGDAPYLRGITAHVEPVTDNHPSRISNELVMEPPFVPLYAAMMDERDRVSRFTGSAFIGQVWPPELAARTPPYFRQEGLIKFHFTAGLYPPVEPQFPFEAIDDLLTNTTLETLPLWLLGTDRDWQRNARLKADLADSRPDIATELAWGRMAKRDYAGALQVLESSMSRASGNPGVGQLQLLLYLLAKNGRAADARGLIDNLDTSKSPELAAFVAWFGTKFTGS